jgi:hypothetical protein
MSIDSIIITQDNKQDNVDLLSIHSPLVFIVDVEYSLTKPDQLNVEVLDSDSVSLATFRAIEYSEANSVITYIFKANDVLDSFMGDVEDFESSLNVLDYVDGITKGFTLRFYIDAVEVETSFVAIHSASQFGDYSANEAIYNNENLCFYGIIGEPVYVYFYNSNDGSNLAIGEPIGENDYYFDYDDEAFLDYDDYTLRGN